MTRGGGPILHVGRYSIYFTARCYTGILLFMAVRISSLVLQHAEQGFVSIVQLHRWLLTVSAKEEVELQGTFIKYSSRHHEN